MTGVPCEASPQPATLLMHDAPWLRRISNHERALDRLETTTKSVMHVVDELPRVRAEVQARTTEVETKLSMELGKMHASLGSRLQVAEKDLRGKAAASELRKLALDLEGHARKDETHRIQEMVDRVQKEASERIDDISERTFTLRGEIAEKNSALQAETVRVAPESKALIFDVRAWARQDAMTKRLEHRTARVEDKSLEVSRFLVKAEHCMASKVATDELERMRKQHGEQLGELRALLVSQMAMVRARAEENVSDVRRVRSELEQLARKAEVEPVVELATELRRRVDDAALAVLGKADEAAVRHELFKLEGVQDEQQAQLASKAETAPTQQAHSAHASETNTTFSQLKVHAEALATTIANVEERLNQLQSNTDAKADRRARVCPCSRACALRRAHRQALALPAHDPSWPRASGLIYPCAMVGRRWLR